jgi:predicted SprT family Zn-dependent metalloprotease
VKILKKDLTQFKRLTRTIAKLYITKGNHLYKTKIALGKVVFEYNKDLTIAAGIYCDNSQLFLKVNLSVVLQDIFQFLTETIVHEVAHIFDIIINDPKTFHSKSWKKITKDLSGKVSPLKFILRSNNE